MHKDIVLALDLAKQLGVSLPAGSAAREVYSKILNSAREDVDYAAIGRYWDKAAGAK
jgi:3-hydroxyisobutyrate dehydrogenase-like beta-hydroxyacid dehydrogenase